MVNVSGVIVTRRCGDGGLREDTRLRTTQVRSDVIKC